MRSTVHPGTLPAMEGALRYRGREVSPRDVAFIRELIAANPTASRRALSRKLCQEWGWVQANGELRDMVCRGMLLELSRAGRIELPPPRYRAPLSQRRRRKPERCSLHEGSPIEGNLSVIRPLEIRQVRRGGEEPLFGSLLETYHYLGYVQPVGEHLKYMVYSSGRPVACLAFSSAVRHLGCRDRFLGWSKESRRKNIRLISYNTRFLILPWVKVRHLASHLLGKMARRISGDWKGLYRHPIYFLETFVDRDRFAGTCYRAANWIYLGRTTGRGKDDQTGKPNRSLKDVWGYPLVDGFRERLGVL